MTISTQASSTVFAGNGSTTSFGFSWIAGVPSNLVVTYTDASGVGTVLTQGSQYTAVLNAPVAGQIWGVGGTIAYPLTGAPIQPGTYLTVQRIVPITQLTSISNQGDFYPQAVEKALDTLCMEIQGVSARAARAIVVNPADQNAPLPLPPVAQRALQMMGFDADGNPIAAEPSSALVSSAMQPFVASATVAAATGLLQFLATGAGAIPRSLQSKLGDVTDVRDYGATGNGTTDDTAAIQAAANAVPAAGGGLYFPGAAVSYVVSKAIVLKSRTYVYGDGPQSLMMPSASSVNDSQWTNNACFVNAGGAYDGLTKIASDISIDKMGFDGSRLGVAGAFHAIRFGQTTRTRVTNCYFNNFGDGVAHIGCQDTICKSCFATGTTNAGYDHWGGTVNASVEACTVYAAGSLAYGILFTAQDTDDTQPLTSSGFRCIDNAVFGAQQAAIWVNVLGSGVIVDQVFQAILVGNTITGPTSGPAAGGIKISGSGGLHIVANNTIFGVNGGPPIAITNEPPLTTSPAGCMVSQNVISSCTVSSGNIAVIVCTGDQPLIMGNNFVTCAAPNLVYVTGNTPSLITNTGGGYTAAKYNTASATEPLILDVGFATGTFIVNTLMQAAGFTGPVNTPANAIALEMSDSGALFANGANGLANLVPGNPGVSGTSLQLRVNSNAGPNITAVLLGAVNSGGTGLRALVVPN